LATFSRLRNTSFLDNFRESSILLDGTLARSIVSIGAICNTSAGGNDHWRVVAVAHDNGAAGLGGLLSRVPPPFCHASGSGYDILAELFGLLERSPYGFEFHNTFDGFVECGAHYGFDRFCNLYRPSLLLRSCFPRKKGYEDGKQQKQTKKLKQKQRSF